ncbi:uncharacterized protein [Narcine bancroftii]
MAEAAPGGQGGPAHPIAAWRWGCTPRWRRPGLKDAACDSRWWTQAWRASAERPAWATGSITNVDKGQHCLVERVKLNISEICPFVTILAKGFLYKALTQKSFTHTASLEEQFSQRRMKTLTGGKNGVFTIAIVGKMPINVSCHVPITEERQETKNQLLLLASAAGTRTGLFYLQDDTFLVDTSAEVRLLPPNLF